MINVYEEKEELIENLYEVLEMIFKNNNIYKTIEYFNTKSIKSYNLTKSMPSNEAFRRMAYDKFNYYSITEIDNIYQSISEFLNENKKKNIFHLILYLAQCCLKIENRQPICKYNKLLKWRMASLKLDSDLFISIFLAKSDLLSQYNRQDFNWSDTIKNDNINIHKILNKGVSENHYHLKGSAPHFNISWISLMNDVCGRASNFKKSMIDINLLENRENINSFKDLILLAASIRMWIYHYLYNINNDCIENFNCINIDSLKLKIIKIQNEINSFRYKGITKKEDYFNKNVDEHFYCGEKRMLYWSMREVLTSENPKFQKLLYIYLLIKSQFRAEIIQLNSRSGFENFQFYQKRKKDFLKTKKQKELLITESIMRSIRTQNLCTLEARIVPELNYNEMINSIRHSDRIIIDSLLKEKNCWKIKNNSDLINQDTFVRNYNILKNRMYYVFHYPKLKDKKIYRMLGETKPRNYKMRKYLKQSAINFGKMREYSDIANRVLGIDGCGNELGCRPEIFGQAFRYLKDHFIINNIPNKDIPILKITYHVGEDFLDIVDGLRAVEEALRFLNMSEGDRIGHGLVLGVDVSEWYYTKNYKITISKQNYIDNIAWIIYKIKKYNIPNKFKYIAYLEPIFNKLYIEIYGDNINSKLQDNNLLRNISVDEYYESWLLRGDDPDLYISGSFKEPSKLKYWNRCSKNPICSDKIRNNRVVSRLYYLYNFDYNIRKIGNEIITVNIDSIYVEIVEDIQKLIRENISIKGICIETNPSSNFLIGTFKRYDKHPITKFYSNNLFDRSKVGKEINVSINTDDQGVFNTYLENEYSLMAISLEKAKDKNGQLLYDKQSIYRWIDEVRKMGIMQSFLERN